MKPALSRSEFAGLSAVKVDCEQYRLRTFVELLERDGEIETVDDKIEVGVIFQRAASQDGSGQDRQAAAARHVLAAPRDEDLTMGREQTSW
jgi:hypothetical protein